MKVLLVANVPKLGRAGELIEVSDAQARNFLIPKKFAVAATAEVVAKHAQQQAARQHKHDRDEQQRQVLITALEGSRLMLRAKSNPQGKLFAAVKSSDIVQAIEQTHHIRLSQVRMEPDHIKTVGEHAMTLWLDEHRVAHVTIVITHGA